MLKKVIFFLVASAQCGFIYAQSRNESTCPTELSAGNLGMGVAAMDNATGNGWLLWSEQPVAQRFSPTPHGNNADHFIAVHHDGNQWLIDNNSQLYPFSPEPSDCLIATLDFSNDSASIIADEGVRVFGIDSGSPDLTISITPNRWNNAPNAGEFGLSVHSRHPAIESTCPTELSAGNLGMGVAAMDNATGNGWLLWSEQPVAQRFSPTPHGNNADHFIAVHHDGNQWLIDNNSQLYPFSPEPSDCLIATLDFSNDSASIIADEGVRVFGIDSGSPDLTISITPNRWNNAPNAGEFGLSVHSRHPAIESTCPTELSAGDLGMGVAAMDNATGNGWLLWSEQPVAQRFSPTPHGNNADHFIAVRHDGNQWLIDNNSQLYPFSPEPSDCLIATLDFSNDSASIIADEGVRVFGIDSGSPDLTISITPNRWNNAPNAGEFGLSVHSRHPAIESTCPTELSAGNLGMGVAAMDNATGNGWLLWSEQPVAQRFSPTPHGNNADHFIAVHHDGNQWLIDNNSQLYPFSPEPSDCLIATLDFSNDSASIIADEGVRVFGIDSGSSDLTISITPNRWNNAPNAGEFSLSSDSGTQPASSFDVSGYNLVFQDEFTTATLNPQTWDTALLWGPYMPINNEQQLYVDTLGMHSSFSHSPFELTGDSLKIVATPVNSLLQPPPRPPESDPAWQPRPYSEYRYNGPRTDQDTGTTYPGYQPEDVDYLSGIITSYGSFKMTHGYVEIRARMSGGRGLWPAFWMLPIHYVKDVPEIDIMEFLGQDVDILYNTYHYFDTANNWAKVSTPSFPVYSSDWTKDWHTFGMSWSPRKITWHVDGIETHEITDADYRIANQPMYLIANIAVGGNWPGAPDASTLFPATLEIDYIRAYKKKLSDTLDLASDYQLMFADEFNGSMLDASKWNTHFLWGPYLPINNEEQYYIDALGSDAELGYSPFTVSDGKLTITARTADDPAGVPPPVSLPALNEPIWADFNTFYFNEDYTPGNYTSGLITSYDSFKFAHGYAEIRAKIPEGDGLWPAFWLLNGYYVGLQPEIDVMEVRGENPNQIIHSYHRSVEGNYESTSYTTNNDEKPIVGYADAFHRYGVRWEPGKITWYIDGIAVHSYSGDDVAFQVMYVIANLAVGGNFNFSSVDPAKIPAELIIDYVRVYQEKDPA